MTGSLEIYKEWNCKSRWLLLMASQGSPRPCSELGSWAAEWAVSSCSLTSGSEPGRPGKLKIFFRVMTIFPRSILKIPEIFSRMEGVDKQGR